MEELELRKNVILNLIYNCNVHIEVLENDIDNNPESDVIGKPLRQDVLEDYYNQKNVLEKELIDIEQLINLQ